MKNQRKNLQGFTLIELLVVISIIAVLSGIATPVIMSRIKAAKILKAKTVCRSFEVAVDAFENEYNYLPYSGTAPTDDTKLRSDENDGLVAVLAGLEDVVNFKQIKYIKYPAAKSKRDGMTIRGNKAALYDPWGEFYYIIMDYDRDEELENPFESGSANNIRGKNVLIYSGGPDKEVGRDDKKKNRDNASNFK